MRKTKSLIAVAGVLMQDPGARHWGYELQTRSGIRSGVMYPLLKRLLVEGWLEDGWEDPASIEGRPPRRYYTLTEVGVRELGALAAPVPVQGSRPRGFREGFAR